MAQARQRAAKSAASNAKTAAKASAAAVKNGAAVVEDVVEEAPDATQMLRGVGEKSGTLGMGFLGLAVSLWSGAYAYSKFREAMGKPVVPIPAPPAE